MYIIPSLPSRGAWIEIRIPARTRKAVTVAPLAGSVDRNVSTSLVDILEAVAPLAGSVDRNAPSTGGIPDLLGRSPRGERG